MIWRSPQYPLLSRVAKLYKGVDLSTVLLLACQHLLTPQQKVFELLLRAGLKPENCIIVGKNYSTNARVLNALRRRGCVVAPFSHEFDPLQAFDPWFEAKLDAFLAEVLATRPLANYRTVIVLDDGGFMHQAVNKLGGDLSNVVGIEQTSSGARKIDAMFRKFPYASVARSHHKLLYETPFIGRIGYERIIRHVASRGKTNPNVLVMGLGHVGRQIAGQLLCKNRWNGFATDRRGPDCWDIIGNGTGRRLDMDRRIIGLDRAFKLLGTFDVIVGCAGAPVMSTDTFKVYPLHPEVSLISMSSSDREFPALYFRSAGDGLHDDCYRGRQCLVNAGFPITFDGRPHAMPPQQIEFTMALLLSHLMDEVSEHLHPIALVVEQIRSIWDPHKGADAWYTKALGP